MSGDAVFAIAKGLVGLPANPRYTAGSGATESGIGLGGVVPGAQAVAPKVDRPAAPPGYTVPPMPGAPTISNSPSAATFADGASAVLNWANPPATLAPVYGTPHAPGGVPVVSIAAPPLDYPQLAQSGLDGDAGLRLVPKPRIVIGTRPGLINPSLEKFAPVPIGLYDGDLPDYPPVSATQLGEPEALDYSADAALIERLKVTLAGNDVLAAAIQAAIYAERTRGLERAQLMGVQRIVAGAAARGFSMPTGAVNAQVAELAHEIREKRSQAAFETRDEAYERAHKLLVEATGRAIAHEAKRFELHLRYAKQLVQTLQFNVRAARELFDTSVGLFNVKVDLIKGILGDYKAYVRAVEAQDAAKVAEVRAELEKALTYGADVDMYEAQVGTARAVADIETTDARQQALVLAEYEAYLVGAMADVDVVRANVDSFREAIRAFGKALDAENDRFDAQAEQVRATGSMVGVWEANIGAYSSFWRTEGDRASAYASYVQDSGRVLDAQVDEFRQYAQAHRSWVQAQTARVSAQASAIGAYARAARVAGGYTSAYNRAQAEYAGAVNMQNMAIASASMNDQALRASEEAFAARQKANALATNATISAGLAQSALGVVDVGVGVGGEVSARKSGEKSGRTSYTHNAQRSWSHQRSHR